MTILFWNEGLVFSGQVAQNDNKRFFVYYKLSCDARSGEDAGDSHDDDYEVRYLQDIRAYTLSLDMHSGIFILEEEKIPLKFIRRWWGQDRRPEEISIFRRRGHGF